MQVDFKAREVTIKIVYYGPALSGKTANLQSLHRLVSQQQRSRMMELATKDDRTLFFDLLPMTFQSGDLSLRLKVFTVPGQVIHNATRRLVLQGADGVAFIADSQRSQTQSNADAFLNLKQNLRDQGVELREMPLVIQFNKRDMPEVRSDAELDTLARRGREPVFRAVALRDQGVAETFVGLLDMVLEHLDRQTQLTEKFHSDRTQLFASVCEHLKLSPEAGQRARLGGAR